VPFVAQALSHGVPSLLWLLFCRAGLGYYGPMRTDGSKFYDPLIELRRKLGLTLSRCVRPDGEPYLRVTMSRRLNRDERARARFILRRWRRLLLLQLDVEEGGNPRTVHQLMARGVLHVQKGRYMMVPDTAPRKPAHG